VCLTITAHVSDDDRPDRLLESPEQRSEMYERLHHHRHLPHRHRHCGRGRHGRVIHRGYGHMTDGRHHPRHGGRGPRVSSVVSTREKVERCSFMGSTPVSGIQFLCDGIWRRWPLYLQPSRNSVDLLQLTLRPPNRTSKLNLFSRFCTAQPRDRQTGWLTHHTTGSLVTIVRVMYVVHSMRPNNAQ